MFKKGQKVKVEVRGGISIVDNCEEVLTFETETEVGYFRHWTGERVWFDKKTGNLNDSPGFYNSAKIVAR